MVINGLKTKKLHTDLMTLALKKKKIWKEWKDKISGRKKRNINDNE